MSEKHLALMASTVALVLAAMSATALIMVNSVRTEMNAQQEATKSQTQEIAQLQSVVTQLKENQLAMLPLLDPGRRGVAEPGSRSLIDEKAPSITEGKATPAETSDAHDAGSVHPAPSTPADHAAEQTPSATPVAEQPRNPPVAVAKPVPMGPSAPTPAGVKIFPTGDTQFIAPTPAAESGAPQASLAQPEETILAAIQTPTMGMKAHPVLDQIQEVSYAETPKPAPPLKKLENVDSILVQRIIANWKRPDTARNGMAVEILIKMARDGSVNSASVVTSSGDKGFDTSATSAILAVKGVPEMIQVSDATYKKLYKERRIRFSPEDLSG